MFHQLKLTLYAIILTLPVVLIMPFASEAADTPPASPIEKNNTGSWKTGPSKEDFFKYAHSSLLENEFKWRN